ncbi:YbhB/YbcL family Raf kinase inhibitor-like protein [Methylocystis iwaonis]|uniref:YbhB/YbcL family Raf kinase inhibitor-like protein n=1 Tax=Methylocystis iwaonis TaxID=2885079 RepID=UPI002E7B4FAD|nr:YbhB/YbcL family Raf kinase inhibitor-like protein [Methylocystis iwaonis]
MRRSLSSFFAFAALAAADAGGAQAFELKSPDIAEGKTIDMKHVYNSFGCTGGNLSPALNWTDPPAGTKSFAVLVHDPDAPTGGAGFWHWLVVDIPPDVRGLELGAGDVSGKKLPPGAHQLETDFGEKAYGGPCPPPGKPHRYIFTVYALKIDKLGDAAHGRTAVAGFTINGNALAKASITGLFGR